ncbi:MAG TPA: GTP cyclohydrolase II [Candidatus Saccharimonadales bacterium]|nr:GTP cyclohydrolase II [Candidatus Saccharimonadales bacterium]
MKNVAKAFLPTKYGNFEIYVYKSGADNCEHAVLTIGDLSRSPVLTRIHSKCLTGDTFSSLKCDCQDQLHKSMAMIGKKGRGIIIYLNQEGRGIGLENKIKAYALQEEGLDTVDAQNALGLPVDARDYKIAADILMDLKVKEINLLTNNPDKVKQLNNYGIKIVERISLDVGSNKIDKDYLLTKKNKLGHILKINE